MKRFVSRRAFLFGASGMLVAASSLAVPGVRRLFHPLVMRLRGRRTIDERLAEFGPARERVRVAGERAGVAWPPGRVVLVGLKDEKRLEVFAGLHDGPLKRVATYPILAASGTAGPKLREGDRQVPEGVYGVESLNADSRFHVALRVDYPNDFDRHVAAAEGRTQLGGDIMIHGGAASVGCLAMGDPAAEELFVLAAEAGIKNVTILLAPVDLRTHALPSSLAGGWRDELYAELKARLADLPVG